MRNGFPFVAPPNVCGTKDGRHVALAASRPSIFERREAAIAPVYDISQIFEDPHYKARSAIVTVDEHKLGPTRTVDGFPRLACTTGAVGRLGPRPGADTDDVLAELGYTSKQIEAFREALAVDRKED